MTVDEKSNYKACFYSCSVKEVLWLKTQLFPSNMFYGNYSNKHCWKLELEQSLLSFNLSSWSLWQLWQQCHWLLIIITSTVNCQLYYWDVNNSGSVDDEAHSTQRSRTFCSQLHQTSKLQVLVKSDKELCIGSFMQSISKAEQPHTCLASPDAVV